ncbi:MAG: hypothetical protein WC756_13370 [Taibaiella sp.]|jgi:hypothetical protein
MAAPLYNHRPNATANTILPFDTTSCFDLSFNESLLSPIDTCFDKIADLNLIFVRFSAIVGIPQNIIVTQNNLVLLGYISAVESYIREIIRKLIVLDGASRISSEEQQLNYGAAINYNLEMLPEALLERSSFASKANIIEAFKVYLGLKGHTPPELTSTLEEFEKICHFRHCVVHRFGKLGSSNAIKFGLDNHSIYLEKPLSLDAAKLFVINQVCENTVLVINDYLFKRVLTRTVEVPYNLWKWDLRKDKKTFAKYFNLFHSTRKPGAVPNMTNAYRELIKFKNG